MTNIRNNDFKFMENKRIQYIIDFIVVVLYFLFLCIEANFDCSMDSGDGKVHCLDVVFYSTYWLQDIL